MKGIIQIAGILIVVSLVGVGIFGPMVGLFAEKDYDTGLSLDTSVNIVEHKRPNYDPHPEKVFLRAPDPVREAFVKPKYIVSWAPGEHSQLITVRFDFDWHNRKRAEGWFGWFGTHAGVLLGRYYMKITYIDTNLQEHIIVDMKDGVNPAGDMWDTTYIEMVKARFPPDTHYKSHKGYLLPNEHYKKFDDESGDLKGELWADWADGGKGYWDIIETEGIEFYMKGLRIGGLKAECYLNVAYRKNGVIGWNWKPTEILVGTDEVYLASGEGEINILGTNRIVNHPEESQEQTEGNAETNEWYTKFVFEEESQIKFEVDTGFSGTSLDPGDTGYGAGWTVAIYDSDGKNRQTWDKIPDDTRGLTLTYTVPSGAFKPGEDNVWRVVLKNTLFDQAEVRLFVVDSLEKVPFGTTITMDKTKYKEGDTAYITLKAQANPAGTGEISKFWVIAKWGTTSSTYKFYGPKYLDARKISGMEYSASFQFEIPADRPVTQEYLYIRAHAIDKDGRAGPEGEKTPYIEQKPPEVGGEQDWIPQVGADYTIILFVILIIVAVIGIYIFILYKQGKIKFKRIGKKGGKK